MNKLLKTLALAAVVSAGQLSASAYFTEADGANDPGTVTRARTFAAPLSTRAKVEAAATVLGGVAVDDAAADAVVDTLKAVPTAAGRTLGDAGEVFEHLTRGGGHAPAHPLVDALGRGYDEAGILTAAARAARAAHAAAAAADADTVTAAKLAARTAARDGGVADAALAAEPDLADTIAAARGVAAGAGGDEDAAEAAVQTAYDAVVQAKEAELIDADPAANAVVPGSGAPKADEADASVLARLAAVLGRVDKDGNVEGVDAGFDEDEAEGVLQTLIRVRRELASTIAAADENAYGWSLARLIRGGMAVVPEPAVDLGLAE